MRYNSEPRQREIGRLVTSTPYVTRSFMSGIKLLPGRLLEGIQVGNEHALSPGRSAQQKCALITMPPTPSAVFFLVSYVGERPRWPRQSFKASTMEERRKRKAKRRERSDEVYWSYI